jgi:hypothetical protein
MLASSVSCIADSGELRERQLLHNIGFDPSWIEKNLCRRHEAEWIDSFSSWMSTFLEVHASKLQNTEDAVQVLAPLNDATRAHVLADWSQNGSNPLFHHMCEFVMHRILLCSPEFRDEIRLLAKTCGQQTNFAPPDCSPIQCIPLEDSARKKEQVASIRDAVDALGLSEIDLLFHATSWTGLENILANGPAARGSPNQDFSHGDGMYFAFDVETAVDFCNLRYASWSGECAVLIFTTEQFQFRTDKTYLDLRTDAKKETWKDVIRKFRSGKCKDYKRHCIIEGPMCNNAKDSSSKNFHPVQDGRQQLCFRRDKELEKYVRLAGVLIFIPDSWVAPASTVKSAVVAAVV